MESTKTASRGRCFSCGESLRRDAVMAMDRLYHPEHFRCYSCRQPIVQSYLVPSGGGMDDNSDGGRPYCAGCYADDFNPKCFGCGQTLRDTCVVAMEKHWHRRCFVCAACRREFDKNEYYLLDGRPYDLDCHWERRLDKHVGGAKENLEQIEIGAPLRPSYAV